jgi:regulator of sigma E protease
LQKLQTKKVSIIVQREENLPALSWKDADNYFAKSLDLQKIEEITSVLGSPSAVSRAGNFYLLEPIEPKPLSDLPLDEEQKQSVLNQESSFKKQIETIQDQKEKARALQQLESSQKQLKLGVALYDAPVSYNPAPWVLFSDVIKDAWRTLSSLFTGMLSPKWMSGPVGIVQVIQQSWTHGVKEALFWMGLISLNLGILNLLPIPVLDGGHICFSLVEMVTKKPIKAKTMERLIFPFILALVALFVFLTYHDLSRIFTRYF